MKKQSPEFWKQFLEKISTQCMITSIGIVAGTFVAAIVILITLTIKGDMALVRTMGSLIFHCALISVVFHGTHEMIERREVIFQTLSLFLLAFQKRTSARFKESRTSRYFRLTNYLPAEKAEEILGDLAEMKMMLEETGYSKWQVWRAMTYQRTSILLSFKYQQVTDWLSQQTRVNK